MSGALIAACYAIVTLHNRQVKALIDIEYLRGTGSQQEVHVLSLLRLSSILDHTVPSDGDTFSQAVNLRNAIYQRVNLGHAEDAVDFDRFGTVFSSSLRDRTAQICGGLTILYMAALEARGIPARYVGIFSTYKMDKKPDTHASVEFYYNGKWIASDPTFNVMFKQGDRYLSYPELYQAIRSGQHFEVVSNGFPLIEGRRLDQYYISLKDLMKYVVVDPARVYDFSTDKMHSYKLEVLPKTWDGMLVYDGSGRVPAGHIDSADDSPSLYSFLEDGPLR
jgi:hypothetical protein